MKKNIDVFGSVVDEFFAKIRVIIKEELADNKNKIESKDAAEKDKAFKQLENCEKWVVDCRKEKEKLIEENKRINGLVEQAYIYGVQELGWDYFKSKFEL